MAAYNRAMVARAMVAQGEIKKHGYNIGQLGRCDAAGDIMELKNFEGFEKKEYGYTKDDGYVRHLDGSCLDRPLDMPGSQRKIMKIFVAIAIVIAGCMLFSAMHGIKKQVKDNRVAVEENLAHEVSYDLPILVDVIEVSDFESLKQSLTDAGMTIYDNTTEQDAAAGNISLVKLPAGLSELDAANMLVNKGIANLNAADASRLMNGSWNLEIKRDETLYARLTYTDFTSGDRQSAIQNAIMVEGFDPASVDQNASGIDEVGNMYQSGTTKSNTTTYTWKVSVIPLSDVFDISGLPEDALYVGIRLSV